VRHTASNHAETLPRGEIGYCSDGLTVDGDDQSSTKERGNEEKEFDKSIWNAALTNCISKSSCANSCPKLGIRFLVPLIGSAFPLGSWILDLLDSMQ
jgi:hypothetical protein